MSNYIHPIYEFFKGDKPPESEPTKECTTCEEQKPLWKYSKESASKNSRLRNECQDCNWNNRQFLGDLRETLVEPFWDKDKEEGDPCQRPGCGRTDKKLTLDHCHVTDKPRGWLCTYCNRSIGQLGDTIESAYDTVQYFKNAALGLNIEYAKPNPMADEFLVMEDS